MDWALDGPIPWAATAAARASTVHLADGMDHFVESSCDLMTGRIPAQRRAGDRPDGGGQPHPQPARRRTAWGCAYPQKVRSNAGGELKGRWDFAEAELFADRIEGQIGGVGPGLPLLDPGPVLATPPILEASNSNLVGGAIDGSSQIHQQLVSSARYPAWPPRRRRCRGLYLGS